MGSITIKDVAKRAGVSIKSKWFNRRARGDNIEDIVDMTELPKETVIELKKKYQK